MKYRFLVVMLFVSSFCIAQKMESFSSLAEKSAYEAYIKDTTKVRYHVGQLYGGGVIVSTYFAESLPDYTLTPHGLIMSLTDIGEKTVWDTTVIRGYHGGGYNDWFLPTSDQINRLKIWDLKAANDSLNTPLDKKDSYWCRDKNELGLPYCYNLQQFGLTKKATMADKFGVRAFRKF